MPEGHILHRLARLHQRRFAGAPVRVSSPQGRFEAGAAVVDGQSLTRAGAWGKHLFHHYAGGAIVHVHLGIYGHFTEFRLLDHGAPEPVGQVRMRMIGAEFGTDLRGPATCAVIDEAQHAGVIARLGPDPLRSDADPALAFKRITKSRKTIAALLMDQSVLAGVGNVYRSEVLFRHRIDPYRPGTEVTEADFGAIWTDLVTLMKVGLRRGNIVVVRPEDDHGEPAYAPGKPRTYVYRRAGDPCRLCRTIVRTAQLEGRNVFWCPSCQTG
ncbi:Fpg/Nei family DNA glycosylase [[Mycobacterium] crassicus]|uniref:DNA-(apurinic or apyrimidinic site) lyase n=1 Tax=[Mycobacterium] crassicus TaxID=2872309 RepID=A0ABU5XEE2_9MYCO|nr:DNA-formamidopyrimidine glycosylase family protein [Mycolicibacter sp. MYC098]MEB3020629.1 DNA-formamidopyrimidine glycosylase family protein [Mycolicibacter sp. MYC098]